MFYSGFDALFSILFPLVFLVVLGMILFTVVSNLRTWSKNNASPRLTVPATVVAKRMNVSRHHTANAGDMTGAHGVIIPKRRSASLNATVFKTSAGAASWLPVARVSNLAATIDMLKENGVWIYGTDGEGQSYTEVKLTGPIGLIVGSEGFGMGRLIKDKCDFLLSLPMAGKVNSLNASVAAGIFMYEAVRQRNL